MFLHFLLSSFGVMSLYRFNNFNMLAKVLFHHSCTIICLILKEIPHIFIH